jgi:hypothetical protein
MMKWMSKSYTICCQEVDTFCKIKQSFNTLNAKFNTFSTCKKQNRTIYNLNNVYNARFQVLMAVKYEDNCFCLVLWWKLTAISEVITTVSSP